MSDDLIGEKLEDEISLEDQLAEIEALEAQYAAEEALKAQKLVTEAALKEEEKRLAAVKAAADEAEQKRLEEEKRLAAEQAAAKEAEQKRLEEEAERKRKEELLSQSNQAGTAPQGTGDVVYRVEKRLYSSTTDSEDVYPFVKEVMYSDGDYVKANDVIMKVYNPGGLLCNLTFGIGSVKVKAGADGYVYYCVSVWDTLPDDKVLLAEIVKEKRRAV